MKNGIKYFPTQSAISMDHEVIISKYGLEGYAIIDLIIHKIYDDEGYFCRWDEDGTYVFARYYGVKADFVCSVVDEALTRGIFSRELYEKYKILSSEDIQKNFFEATKRRRKLEFVKEYIIADDDKKCNIACKSGENVNINGENADNFQQRRGEEKRGDETKGEEMKVAPVDATCKGASGTSAADEKETVDFQAVGEAFNRICTSLVPVQAMSGRRKTSISETAEIVKDRGGFEKLFENVRSSDFLCGKNKNGWKATFDWVIKADNAVKILEGNFGNKKPVSAGSFDVDDFFAAALRNSYGPDYVLEDVM